MKVKWLKKTLQNLDEEADYIAQNHPQAAQLVVRRIVEAVALLSRQSTPVAYPARAIW